MIGKSLDETIHGATQFGTHIGNLGQNIRDTQRDVIKEMEKKEGAIRLNAAMKILTEKERYVVMCTGKGMTLSEIGEKLCVSRQAIYKTLTKAFVKIKSNLTNNAL